MAIQYHGQVMVFGGISSSSTDYKDQIWLLDLKTNEWSISRKKIMLGDMFYYNQISVSRFQRKTVAVLGKEHVHYFDLRTFMPVGIVEDDGDHA